MSDEEKIRENRVRRAAARQKLVLTKSRRRDPRAIDYGKYWLSTLDGVVELDGGTLEDVERFLQGE